MKPVVVGKGKQAIGSAGGFGHYNLSPEVTKAIKSKGYNQPTPI